MYVNQKRKRCVGCSCNSFRSVNGKILMFAEKRQNHPQPSNPGCMFGKIKTNSDFTLSPLIYSYWCKENCVMPLFQMC